MKALLNFVRQLDEINFRDPLFAFEHDAIGFHSAHRNVFVFFPINRFKVLGQR